MYIFVHRIIWPWYLMMTYYQGKVSYFLQRSKQTFIIKRTEEGIALDSVLDERVVTRVGKWNVPWL